MGQSKKSVVVVGGGIIGLCIAEKLSHEGLEVTLVEKEKVAAGASYGNAAGFAFSEIMPLASPSTIKKSIGWFLDPMGPFAVVPQDLPRTFGWLLRFVLAARRSVFKRSTKALSDLMRLEKETLKEFHDRTGLDSMVKDNGALYLYEKHSQYQADLKNWQFRGKHGIEFECYEGPDVHNFQSGLSEKVVAGIFVPNYPTVSNPNDYCQAIHKINIDSGVTVLYQEVASISKERNGAKVHLKGGKILRANKVVVAGGPWSAKLASNLGDKVSLVGERGYNTTLPKSALPDLKRTLFFSAHGFVMAPLVDGVRVGGASEIATLERAPRYKRSKNMLAKARSLMPELKIDKGEEWMGRRPTMPDTLPVISLSAQCPHVVYAFGHGHLGLTLSSSTAQLVSDLIHERKPSIDLTSLRVDRF